MDASFWHEKWAKNEIAFHGSEANPLLVQSFDRLALAPGSRVFVPLCGKTLDIHWLLGNGYRVAGAELSKAAIGQLFAELGVEPRISPVGAMERYSAECIDIFAGDFFALSREMLGPVDAVYDRAALVALPEETRTRYAAHLRAITGEAPQLLVCYEYDQSKVEGPPFSVSEAETRRHYDQAYNLRLLSSVHTPAGLRGKHDATEHVWLLTK